MACYEGETLKQRIERGPLALDEAVDIATQVGRGLAEAHSAGIVHRDIKPANILLDKDSHVRVADFGLGSSIWEANKEDGEDSPIPQGTLLYISPEQLAGDSLNERSDQYSLASTIYELVSGAPPFHSGEVAAQIQIKSAPAIEYLSKTVNQSLLRALSKSQLKRFSSCMDFYQAIAEAVGESPDQGAGAAARIIDDQNRDTIVLNKASFQTRKTRLGRLLIDSGVISQLQLMDALIYQNKEEVKLGQALIELEFVTPNQIIEILSEQLQIPMVTLKDEAIDTGIANTIGKQTATLYHCIPLRKTAYGVLVAVADPLDMEMLNFLEEAFWNDIELRVAAESEIDAMVEEVYP